MGIVKEILDGVGTISKDWEKGKFKKITLIIVSLIVCLIVYILTNFSHKEEASSTINTIDASPFTTIGDHNHFEGNINITNTTPSENFSVFKDITVNGAGTAFEVNGNYNIRVSSTTINNTKRAFVITE